MKWFYLSLLGLLASIASAQVAPNPSKEVPLDAPHFAPINDDELKHFIGEPTRISLHLKEATSQAAFEAIARQAGLKMGNGSTFNSTAPLTVDYDSLPFWKAVAQTPLKMAFMRFARLDETSFDGPQADHGYFDVGRSFSVHELATIFVSRIDHLHTQAVGEVTDISEPKRTIWLTGCIGLDPKLPTLQSAITVELSEAVDEQGQSLLFNAPRRFLTSYPATGRTEFVVPLDYPPNVGKRIARLKGTLKFPIVLKTEKWNVPDVYAPDIFNTVQGQNGPETYRVMAEKPKTQKNGAYEFMRAQPLKIAIERPLKAPPGIAKWNASIFAPLFHTLEGKQFSPQLPLQMAGNVLEVSAHRSYRSSIYAGVELKAFSLDIPLEVREAQIAFELTDLPLP